MIRIAIYGKGGIGKSTTVSNMSAALAADGYTVMQIGCDPKADSTISLRHGTDLVPVLDTYREKIKAIELEDMYVRGYNGVICVEAGGPTPGIGCAGRGVAKALDLLKQKNYEEILKPDVVFYDVLGDVVCGGFSMPLRKNYADRVYVVSSGEQMSIFAAMNLGLALENFKRRGHNGLSGIIANKRNVNGEDEKLAELSRDLECPIVGTLSYSETVKKASDAGLTVSEAFPGDPMIDEYRKLAKALISE
jgi:nitrogenase iron protein NifH